MADPAQRLAGGTRLRVDGIRYVRAVEDDTRAQVANQNGVRLDQLEEAVYSAHRRITERRNVGKVVLVPDTDC